MSFVLIAFVSILVFAAAAFLFFALRASRKSAEEKIDRANAELRSDLSGLKEAFQNQINQINMQVTRQIETQARFLQESQGYQKTVNNMENKLGQLQEATQRMVEIGRDISSLQTILQAPKLRGGIGELFLGELLRQTLPPDHFSLQYGFSDGRKVDAVIHLHDGMIPVDAKFPLENFQKFVNATDESEKRSVQKLFASDVKKHITQIAEKYILPDEGTFEFALMYIPAENVYYETIIKDEGAGETISEFALKHRVVPVSPNSFYSYLQAIVMGLKGLRIEQSAKLILQNLTQLETDFKKCFGEFDKLGSHINHAYNSYNKALRQFEKFQTKLESIDQAGGSASLSKHESDHALQDS